MAVTSERGQMLLIGALVLAVLFISLSFVLDGSIQTTTVSGEASADVSVSETVALQNSLQRDMKVVIETAIRENPNTVGSEPCNSDGSNQICSVKRNVTALDGSYGNYYARHDRIVTVGLAEIEIGNRTYQEDPAKNFTSPSSAKNWNLSTGSRVRNFTLDVHGWEEKTNDNFTVVITDSEATEKDIQIYNESTETVVEVDGRVCRDRDGSDTTIGITDSTVEGSHCNALDFFDQLEPPYSIRFENGDEINGTYDVIVSRNGNGPKVDDRLYSVNVTVEERSPAIEYNSTIRVAPGEPR